MMSLVAVMMIVPAAVPVVMMMIMVLVIVVMSMLMVMLFMLMVMIMAAALAVLMMLSALRADHFREKLFLQRLAGLHRFQDLTARKLRDRGRDERRLIVELAQDRNSLFNLLRLRLVRTAQDDRSRILDLVAEKLAEVLAVDPALRHIHNCRKTVELSVDLRLHILHRLDDV